MGLGCRLPPQLDNTIRRHTQTLMHSLFYRNASLTVAIALGFALPSTLLAQGLVLRPGTVFEMQFSSMSPSPGLPQSQPFWGIDGTLILSRLDVPFSFVVEVSGGDPFEAYWTRINSPAGASQTSITSFGAADHGSPWNQKGGGVRLTFVSGPAVSLTELRFSQYILVGGTYQRYQAVLPVPEPRPSALIGIAAAAAYGLSRQRRLTRPTRANSP